MMEPTFLISETDPEVKGYRHRMSGKLEEDSSMGTGGKVIGTEGRRVRQTTQRRALWGTA